MAQPPARLNKLAVVDDRMQRGCRDVLSEPVGRNLDPEFTPELTPRQMLELGVFGGKYMTDCREEFPASWFARAKSRRCCTGRTIVAGCKGSQTRFIPSAYEATTVRLPSHSARRRSRVVPRH